MRREPFVKPAALPEASETPSPTIDSLRVDLKERLKMTARANTATEPEEVIEEELKDVNEPEASSNNNEKSNAPGSSASATFDDDEDPEFTGFQDTVKDKMEGLIENPEELAELLVELGNVGRIIWFPGLYEGLMFPGQERNDIRGIVAKSIENEKDNKPADEGMNNYEKRLYAKWPKLQEALQNISYTDSEIKKFSRLLAKQVQTMGVAQWMDKYSWLLYFAYLELRHAKNVISGRVADSFSKKFGL